MADRRTAPRQRKADTQLAKVRIERGVTQEEVARAIGIPRRTYQRLENGQTPNPPLRYLVNAALALKVELADVIDPEWLEWMVFDAEHAEQPPGPGFTRRRRQT